MGRINYGQLEIFFSGNKIPGFFIILCLFITMGAYAQPANDNCANAKEITITNGGFGLGTFNSSTDDITSAKVQAGETFAQTIFQNGLDQKSLWYKFVLPTKRKASVTLLQTAHDIQAGDAGFAIYKSNNCVPGKAEIYDKFTPIEKFGTSAFPCVDSGVYLIQVSSKLNANGKVYIQLYLSDSTGGTVAESVYAPYDRGKDAYDFGKLASFNSHVDFEVSCQTIDNAAEICTGLFKYQQYTKSTWHTFTTPGYFDYIAVLLNTFNTNRSCTSFDGAIGYRLYKGDAKTKPIASLTPVANCDSFISRPNGYADFKIYRCNDLDINTTYSIQLFYRYDFEDNIRLAVAYDGVKPTLAPQPILSQIPASNQLGILAEGHTTASDYFGCNSRHAIHPCGYTLPAAGVEKDGVKYNLSTFYTFKLSSPANIQINGNSYAPSYSCIMRVYKQVPNNNCATLDSAHLLSVNYSNTVSLGCLEAGTYTVQILGTDSLKVDYTYCGSTAGTGSLYLLSHLGQKVDIDISVDYINAINKFSLNANGAYDRINYSAGKLQPLQNTILYNALADTLGCANTVLPPTSTGYYCTNNGLPPSKAIYREFIIGDANNDNKADSGVITLTSLYGYNAGSTMTHILYKGDANSLANTQNKHLFGDTITGLKPVTECMVNVVCDGNKVCATPGTYTLVTLGNQNHVGSIPYDPGIQFDIITTKHYSGATAQNMGNIMDTIGGTTGTVYCDKDYFSCKDNAVTIDGFAPPVINGDTATKAVYRQFYLASSSIVNICSYNPTCLYYSGELALFSGKAVAGLNTLKKIDWQFCQSATCKPLPAGWYTVVCYGAGPTYTNPFQNNEYSYGNSAGRFMQFSINIQPGCEGPQYNRAYKACVDSTTNSPFLVEWKLRNAGNSNYPVYDTTYTLYTEHFNCTVDTPFAAYVKPCSNTVNRVAYYVFKVNKESYVQINTQGLWGEVFNKDIRKDSSLFATLSPIQPCLRSYSQLQICRLQPGTYTLVLFAGNADISNGCGTVTPTLYIDNIGYSRFDHASKAYDFGVIPADSLSHSGKTGDVNPLNPLWAASNDFFYCTTGAQLNDPSEASSCYIIYDSLIYKSNSNNYLYEGDNISYYNNPRRNLWYTFVIDKPGYVHVKVNNKTSDKTSQYPFAVYSSNVDGSISFAKVVSTGQVDSTAEQGLTFINHNHSNCYNFNEVTFYNEPCNFKKPIRYYILVENPYDLQPNSQAEVEILLDSVSATITKFDHYYQADTIGVNLRAGTYTGHPDNFTCASSDATDPVYYSCAPKTLWYKFTTNVTGHIKFMAMINGQNYYDYTYIQLFRQTIPNDSTNKGLIASQYPAYSVYDPTINGYWSTTCISPGTYYIILPGCSQVNQDVYPVIQIEEEAGDFCSAPVIAPLSGPGVKAVTAMIDCHTIGTDYGEFAPTLTCPSEAKTADYKSTWYRIDIGGTDTLDVTVNLTENTTAKSSEIKYRLMTGDCGAMQAQSCVEDALTVNTYRCLSPGSYYVQVFSPVAATGSIDLNVSALLHADTCIPDKNCLATARFDTAFDCTKDSAIQFINSSTYGSSIKYLWNFGYLGKTSTDVSPSFFYPALATAKTYKVTLLVDNISCNKKDSFVKVFSVPARPFVNLGKDLYQCDYNASLILHATSFAGATYQWNYGYTDSLFDASSYKGQRQYSVEVNYKGCSSRDTINVYINPIDKNNLQNFNICYNDSVQLNAYRGAGETYLWNNGVTANNQFVKASGVYWADLSLANCTIRDSFNVTAIGDLHPLGKDTAVCEGTFPYRLDATVSGATGYTWQDGTQAVTYDVNSAGIYWVDVIVGNCSFRDSLTLKIDSVKKISINAGICAGKVYVLPSGKKINNTGIYSDTLRSAAHCDSLVTIVNLKVDTTKFVTIATSICTGQTYQLPSGLLTDTAGTYIDTLHSIAGCDSLVTMVTVKINSPVKVVTAAAICDGQNYILPSGKKVKLPGLYNDTVRSVFGCDSLYTKVDLKVLSVTSVTKNVSICSGQSYTLPSGVIKTVKGVYTDTLKSSAGCDSLITTVNLSVGVPLKVTEDVQVCVGQFYISPSGTKITQQGIYNDTLRSVAGCDSLITTINFSILIPSAVSENVFICKGQTYTMPSGKIIITAGTYIDTLKNIAGCDSIFTTITLATIAPSLVVINAAICSGQFYVLPSGLKVTAQNVYADTLKGIGGCDSLITTVNLTVFSPISTTVNVTICNGQSYTLPSGIIKTTKGVYTDTLKNSAGCDSLVTTVHLSVTAPLTVTKNAEICKGQSYTLPSGTLINKEGIYNDTLKSVAGCDSLITTVNLAILSPVSISKNIFICKGQSYTLPSGNIITTEGIYIDTLKSRAGCDSVFTTVSLATLSPLAVVTSAAICLGQSYTLPSGLKVTKQGVYADTLKSIAGCDSLITTLNLTVFSPTSNTVNATICNGQSYTLPSGIIKTIKGVYTDTLKNSAGCDSLITTVNLSVTAPLTLTKNAEICKGQSYTLPSGTLINKEGIYNDTLKSVAGCDSVVTTVNLAILSPTAVTVNASVCSGQSYTLPSGTVLATEGIYKDTLKSIGGCDSLITTVNLTVQNLQTAIINATICAGQNYILPSGLAVNTTGIYLDTVHYVSGCDSLQRTVNLLVTPAIRTSISASVCSDEFYTLPWGALVNTTGSYRDTIRTQAGCDSLVWAVDLTVLPTPFINVTKSNDVNCTLSITHLNVYGAASYAWSPAASLNDAFISNPVASPGKTTMYQVTATASDGCIAKDSIEVKFVNGNAQEAYLVPSSFSPNNDGLNDCFGVPHWGNVTGFSLIIYNRYGELVFQTNNPTNCWDGLYKGKMQNTGAFVYFIKANGVCGRVDRKGTVMLVR